MNEEIDAKTIVVHYQKSDCKELSIEEMINDLCTTLKQELNQKISFKPKQCSIIINYFGNILTEQK